MHAKRVQKFVTGVVATKILISGNEKRFPLRKTLEFFMYFFDFGLKILMIFYTNFWKFLILGAREGLVLAFREERIQKLVDTGEK